MPPIILATDSLVRKAVFERANLPFDVDAAQVDEREYDTLPFEDRIQKLAYIRCKLVSKRHTESIVIGTDVIMTHNQTLLHRPVELRDAFKMALSLSGETVVVRTGVSLFDPRKQDIATYTAMTKVRYQHFTKEDLVRVFKIRNPLRVPSALGAYIDAPGCTLVDSIEGSYTGAVGMPMEIVYAWLRERQYLV